MKIEMNRVAILATGRSLPLAVLPLALLSLVAGVSCKSKGKSAANANGGASAMETPAPDASQNQRSGEAAALVSAEESQDANSAFNEKVRDARLIQERNAFLVEKHMLDAKRLLDSGALQQAWESVEAARTLAPANEAVLKMRDKIGALLGDRAGVLGMSQSELENMELVRKQKVRTELEQAISKARENLALREFDRATSEVNKALDYLTYSPYAGDWQDMRGMANDLKAKIEAERAADAERMRFERERLATDKMRAEEMKVKAKRAEVIEAKLTIAQNAYIARDFKGARDIASQVLHEDSRNQRAMELREAAIAADEQRVDEDFVNRRRQEFIRLKEEDMRSRILQTEDIVLPPADFWQTISALRDSKVAGDVSEGESEEDIALRAQLSSKKTSSIKFDAETDLDKVAGYFKDVTGVPVLITPSAREKASSTKFQVSLDHPIASDAALTLILTQAPDITWKVKDGAVHVLSKEADQTSTSFVPGVYDVRDIQFPLTEFTGPKFYYLPIPGGKMRLGGTPIENPFGSVGEKRKPYPSEELESLIKETIEPGSWETAGVQLKIYNGQLVATCRPQVQRQLARFLADLRRYVSSSVSIEARFVTISDNFLQAIGVDWRGLDNQFDDVQNGLKDNASAGIDNNGIGLPGNAGGTPSAGAFFDNDSDGSNIWRTENLFDKALGSKLTENGGLALQFSILKGDQASMILKAVEKNLDVQEVNAQMLTVANNQKSYVTVVNQQSYIADYNVEVAQAAFIAEPKIEILQTGVVLEVKPIINYDRKYITLELQPTVAKLIEIRDFTTTLGGLASSVTFQLPSMTIQSASTTCNVPDGGAVLIGGLRSLREVEARAEVPWLGRLPIIGFFFKKEGYNSENENLMILVRARIIDSREEMQRFEKEIGQVSQR